tara:strand:- start:3343 stop:4056 length:714 start_codon:yes stop_codon:yes gene_type:complete
MHKGRKYLVTGGSRGIGRAIAQDLLAQGAEVTITVSRLRPGWWDDCDLCAVITADFDVSGDIESLRSALTEKSFDGLVNNVGVFGPDGATFEADHWNRIMRINAEIPASLMDAASVNMKKGGYGRIVNIGSIASFVTRATTSCYSSSKAALSSLTRSYALKYASDGILVNCICPAYTDTDMLAALTEEERNKLLEKVPLGRFGAPEDIAAVSSFLISPANRFMTGQSIVVDGGVTIQ